MLGSGIGYYVGGYVVKSVASQVVTFGAKAALVEACSSATGEGRIATIGAKFFKGLSNIHFKSLLGGLSVSTVTVGIGCIALALVQPHLALALLVGYIALTVIFGGTVWISKTYYATKEAVKNIMNTLTLAKDKMNTLLQSTKDSMNGKVQEAKEALAKEMGELQQLLHQANDVKTVESINEEKKKFETLLHDKKESILEKFCSLEEMIQKNIEENQGTIEELQKQIQAIRNFGKDEDATMMEVINSSDQVKAMKKTLVDGSTKQIEHFTEENQKLRRWNTQMRKAIGEMKSGIDLMEKLDGETTKIFALWESCLPNVEMGVVSTTLLALQSWLKTNKGDSDDTKAELARTLLSDLRIEENNPSNMVNCPGLIVLQTVQMANATRGDLLKGLETMIGQASEKNYDFTLDKTMQKQRNQENSFKKEIEEGVLPVLKRGYQTLEKYLSQLQQKAKERRLKEEERILQQREFVEKAKEPVIQVVNTLANHLETIEEDSTKHKSLDKEKEMFQHLVGTGIHSESLKEQMAFKKRMEEKKYNQTVSGQIEQGLNVAKNMLHSWWG